MTIQAPEVEAPAMTRREAYDTMIEHLRRIRKLNADMQLHSDKLNKLNSRMPKFHSTSSFDELEQMERLEEELKPDIQRVKQSISEASTEIRALHTSTCEIITENSFNRVSYIYFEHDGQKLYIDVSRFLSGHTEARVDKS